MAGRGLRTPFQGANHHDLIGTILALMVVNVNGIAHSFVVNKTNPKVKASHTFFNRCATLAALAFIL